MKPHTRFFRMLPWSVCLPLILAGQAHALPPLSDSPLFLGGNISPNVMFTLDDSGSMHFEIMPADLIYDNEYYMFPYAPGIYGEDDYTKRVVDFDPANPYTTLRRSSHNNKIYYNPTVTYAPWSNADGSLMANAIITQAYHNPANTTKGYRNLTVNNTETARWLKSDGTFTASTTSKTFYPAVYYRYNGGSINAASSYTQIEIKSTTPSYTGGPDRTDCAAAPTCTYAEEIQNFANWYTYYRSRVLLARAGVGKAFSVQGNTMRVGFAAINKGSTTIDGVSTGAVIRGVRQFTGTDRTDFFTSLYGHVIPNSGTPLLTAMDRVGKYFKRADDKGPWGETPGTAGGTQHECRQSYNILMTDGYWNTDSNDPNLGNVDNTSGSSITNHSDPADPASYAYAPALPYSDGHDDTLADVAMYYWKNDLRTNLDNKVPTNSADPAFWQHMVNFTVGLGVTGTLTALPSGTGSWPNPTSDATKIDDLWHAAVNSRGNFFSAADPTTFANALSDALSNIIDRTGSASAVAASSTQLKTNGRLYQAKFNSGNWSGQLLSIPIDDAGVEGPVEWDAGAVINTQTPISRVILTKGSSGDGEEFLYGNLNTVQKAALDNNTAGSPDDCGLERVTYLRGDAANEGISGAFTCASASIVDKFHSRTSKLGDIVNSGPIYVGEPNAGYSDVDHAGYAAFSTDSASSNGYKKRTPMVYVGANDGTLHGFNACIAGVTPGCTAADEGKELIAYIPSMVYTNLSRLTDKDYNASHRYFVDGSPMVADANTGTTALPVWKSVLVGSLNAGGQGYFALDVTNPTDTTKTAPTFTTANAASLLLWEFSSMDDADMGYTHNLPPTDRSTGQASQIVKMQNGQWAVVVGNGYNSTGGKAVLYVLFIKAGEDGVWTPGTDYIRLPADNVGPGNGLSTPRPFDSDGDGLADVIYAGDLKGNLWKFDVSDAAPANWGVALSGAPLFAAGTSKPVTSPPVIDLHPEGGQLVMFGTGKYLETGDTTSTSGQTMYGIWDNNGGSVTAGELVQQVQTAGVPPTGSQNPVTYSTLVKGWYTNFPVSGERLVAIPAVKDGILTFTSISPSVSPCDFGGKGKVYRLDFLTGGMLGFPVFDTNGDGVVDANDALSAATEIGFSPGGVTHLEGVDSDLLASSKADGTLVKTPTAKGPLSMRGRITWRELVQ
ncbi:MAG: PilC/PilY family type IV pilus protein [Thiobacillus sp.]